jgi:2-alkyl-3-oxoalkanoate reductase
VSESGRFEDRTALVTGAAGFIGRTLCEALVAEGATVAGADLPRPAAERAVAARGARFVAADVTDPAAVAAAVEGCDFVLHTAAHIREWGEMEEFVELNVRGTVNVLDAAERAGARVVHLSSVVVFGYDSPYTQDERAPLRSIGVPYLDTKSASDRLARLRGAVVVRPGDVYGPGSVPWVVRPLELARRGRLAVPAPGDGRMLPVHVDDLAEAVLLAALAGEAGTAYTAWSGEQVSFREYFDRLVAPIGAGCRVLPRPLLAAAASLETAAARLRGRPPELSPRALTFVDRRGSASTERIRSELGWRPRTDLTTGLTAIAAGLGDAVPAGGDPHA